MVFSFSDIDDNEENYFTHTISDLNKVIIDKNIVCIRCDYTCDCFTLLQPRKPNFYIYKKKTHGITNKDIIDFLIKNNFRSECEHNTLKYFIKSTDVQVIAVF
jgi:hypothetical protein